MMQLETLCERIDLPPAVRACVLSYAEKVAFTEPLDAITKSKTAKAAYQELKALCADDGQGMKLLAYMLLAALNTHRLYTEKHIDEAIYFATMKCFSRFVNEHRASYGTYGFDRGWWAYRQLSMTLFRIGELEYEFREDEKSVHLHVPSDANIDLALCQESLVKFKRFLETVDGEKAEDPVVINSWLLSPALDALLKPDSRIRRFKDCFEIVDWDEDSTEFLQWVYGRMETEYEGLPEKTGLQKSMKAHLLRGGRVGSAKGILRGFR